MEEMEDYNNKFKLACLHDSLDCMASCSNVSSRSGDIPIMSSQQDNQSCLAGNCDSIEMIASQSDSSENSSNYYHCHNATPPHQELSTNQEGSHNLNVYGCQSHSPQLFSDSMSCQPSQQGQEATQADNSSDMIKLSKHSPDCITDMSWEPEKQTCQGDETSNFLKTNKSPLESSAFSPIRSFQQDESRQFQTPPNTSLNNNTAFKTPKNEPSFLRRLSLQSQLPGRAMPAVFSSTPLVEDRHSATLPQANVGRSSTLLRNMRQCRSVENCKQKDLGPGGIPYQYMNPFTPDGKTLERKLKLKRRLERSSLFGARPKFNLNYTFDVGQSRKKDEDLLNSSDMDVLDNIPRRASLKEFNICRFSEEFVLLENIGEGEYGAVFKCVNRMNGCVYAIKKMLKPIKTGLQERVVRNEVYAHGILFHPNIIMNFSCWKEDGHVYLQNEFCNGGNLDNYMTNTFVPETQLQNLLSQIASALKYMHQSGLVHMDIKPGNIFLCKASHDSSSESDGGFVSFGDEEITFKLGDFGHVSLIDDDDPEEGDCRYLSREMMHEKYGNLDKVDIFAFGLTVYEAAGGGPLPKNGPEWQDIRDGRLKYLEFYTKGFNELLKRMTDPSPEKRPSAAELVEMLTPSQPSFPDNILQYRLTNTRLEHTALANKQYARELLQSNLQMKVKLNQESGKPRPRSGKKKKGAVSKTRVVGRKTSRSSSSSN